MASKIITDNPKHHKYVTVNKLERKKKKINIIFNHINKIYNIIDKYIANWSLSSKWRRFIFNEQPLYHGVKGCRIFYDDCNHQTYRVIKNGKFIKSIYRNKAGYLYFAPKHFKRK